MAISGMTCGLASANAWPSVLVGLGITPCCAAANIGTESLDAAPGVNGLVIEAWALSFRCEGF